MYIPFIRKRKIFYSFSATLVIASALAIFIFGLNLGIDFTGGSSLELTYKNKAPSQREVEASLQGIKLKEILIQRKGNNGIVLKTETLDEETYQRVLEKLTGLGKVVPGSESFRSVGPVIGNEVKRKTSTILWLTLLGILIYVAMSFRRVSRPVKSYVYGITSVIALFHDVFIPLGVLAVLGRFSGVELTIPIITAFLTVFGYSINDSVVVFDRIRENLLRGKEPTFGVLVEKSLNQTLSRSLNTSFTTLLVLFAVFFLGDPALKYFSLTLILGISLGTYSSLFLATPLLVSYKRLGERKKQ